MGDPLKKVVAPVVVAVNPIDDAAEAMVMDQAASVERANASATLEGTKAILVQDDEMGMLNPMRDVSTNVEYYFYKCGRCSRKVFATVSARTDPNTGESIPMGDSALVTECTCKTGRMTDRKDREGNFRAEHGVMKLHKYSRPRVAADIVEKQIVVDPDLPPSVATERPAPAKVIA